MPRLEHQNIGLHATGTSPLDVIALSQLAERAGWDGVSVGDASHDSFSMLSAVAATSPRLRVRSGVALLGRAPFQAAIAASTLDYLSQGRFRLGLGSGARERSIGWYDLEYSKPVGRLKDYIAAVRAAWQTSPTRPGSYEGPFYRLSNATMIRPPANGPIPIDIGANGPQMLRLAGQIADGVMFNDLHLGSYLRDVALPNVAVGERRVGREVGSTRRIGALLIALAATREAAIARGRFGIGAYLMISHNREALVHYGRSDVKAAIEAAQAAGDTDAAYRAIPDEVVELFAVCGTPDHCRTVINSYADELDEVILHIPEWRKPGTEAKGAYEELVDKMAPR